MELKKLEAIFKELVSQRIYCSESDIQFALAWKLKEEHQGDVRLELPFEVDQKNDGERNKRKYLDILLESKSGKQAIEIKYKTDEVKYQNDYAGAMSLKKHGAQAFGLYDFWWDVHRIEELLRDKKIKSGFVIFLTNDKFYQNEATDRAAYDAFRLVGRVSGKLTMGERTTSLGGRKRSFKLCGEYSINWVDVEAKGIKFYFVILEVN